MSNRTLQRGFRIVLVQTLAVRLNITDVFPNNFDLSSRKSFVMVRLQQIKTLEISSFSSNKLHAQNHAGCVTLYQDVVLEEVIKQLILVTCTYMDVVSPFNC